MRRVLPLIVTAMAAIGGCSGGVPSPTQEPGSAGRTLQPTPPVIVAACKKVAERITLPVVYCPPAVPRGRPVLGYHGAFGKEELDSYSINGQSPSLPAPYAAKAKREGRPYPPPGHWLVAAARPPSVERSFVRHTDMARPAKTLRLHGVKATLYLSPLGGSAQDSGHAIVYWQRQGIAYTASVHGHVNEPVAEAMASALINEMLRCPSPVPQEHACRLALATPAATSGAAADGVEPSLRFGTALTGPPIRGSSLHPCPKRLQPRRRPDGSDWAARVQGVGCPAVGHFIFRRFLGDDLQQQMSATRAQRVRLGRVRCDLHPQPAGWRVVCARGAQEFTFLLRP